MSWGLLESVIAYKFELCNTFDNLFNNMYSSYLSREGIVTIIRIIYTNYRGGTPGCT